LEEKRREERREKNEAKNAERKNRQDRTIDTDVQVKKANDLKPYHES